MLSWGHQQDIFSTISGFSSAFSTPSESDLFLDVARAQLKKLTKKQKMVATDMDMGSMATDELEVWLCFHLLRASAVLRPAEEAG